VETTPPHEALAGCNAEYCEAFCTPWFERVQLSPGRTIEEEGIKKSLVCLA